MVTQQTNTEPETTTTVQAGRSNAQKNTADIFGQILKRELDVPVRGGQAWAVAKVLQTALPNAAALSEIINLGVSKKRLRDIYAESAKGQLGAIKNPRVSTVMAGIRAALEQHLSASGISDENPVLASLERLDDMDRRALSAAEKRKTSIEKRSGKNGSVQTRTPLERARKEAPLRDGISLQTILSGRPDSPTAC